MEAAAEALRDINPDTRVIPMLANVMTDIGLGLFRDMDVVIGCLDNREARLWVNRCCWKVGTPWIDGGIQEISGVVKVFTPPHGACYECAMTENDYRLINIRYSCPLLRQEDLQAGKVPTAPTISSMIGGLQSPGGPEADPWPAGRVGDRHDLQRRGQQLLLDSVPTTRRLHEPRDVSGTPGVADQCGKGHGRGSLGANLPGIGAGSRHDARRAGQGPGGLHRLRPVWHESRDYAAPAEVGNSDAVCGTCGQIARPQIVHAVEAGQELAQARLTELGIPPYDMLRVVSAANEHVVLLGADRPQ